MARSTPSRQTKHRAIPINPNRVTRGDIITYPNQGTKHTLYRVPRNYDIEKAIEQVRRYKPNAYAFQIMIHKGYGKKDVIITPPFDPDDSALGNDLIGIAVGKCAIPKGQQPVEPSGDTIIEYMRTARPWDNPNRWRTEIIAIE